MMKTIHHIENGPATLYEIDANHAVANFPGEWKETEWTDEEKAAAAKAKAESDASAKKR